MRGVKRRSNPEGATPPASPTGLLLFARNDGRGRVPFSGRLSAGIATPNSTPPLGGYRLASYSSLRGVKRRSNPEGATPPAFPTGLLLFARNDGRGRIPFSGRLSAGIATPNSTPLERVLFSKRQVTGIVAPSSTLFGTGTVGQAAIGGESNTNVGPL
ncbi:MAG: hypothetical protein LBT00_03945 [Spirochaetaceae bacterium]|nr:hypothetical protein [Spirochaetaceae bacterium]